MPVYFLNADFDHRNLLDFTALDPDCLHTVMVVMLSVIIMVVMVMVIIMVVMLSVLIIVVMVMVIIMEMMVIIMTVVVKMASYR